MQSAFRNSLIAAATIVALVTMGVQAQDTQKKIVKFNSDAKSGEIKLGEIAHIRPGGIAGAKTKVMVKGPAKISVKDVPVKNKNGEIVVGPSSDMIEVIPSGACVIEIDISVTNPSMPNEPIRRTFKLTVK